MGSLLRMKKTFIIIITILAFGVLFFGAHQYYTKSSSQRGALQVTSSPASKVYLNGEFLGETPLCRCESGEMLVAGESTIRLVPNDSSISDFQEKIKISKGVLTVVDRKFGRDSSSSGSVISLTPLADSKAVELLVVSIPASSKIYLDNNQIGQTPLLYKNPTVSDHTLRAEKEGYKEKSVRIRTPLGYKLTVSLYLATDDSNQNASSSAQPSPTSAISVSKIVILDTPTGFLRVRESNSLNSQEVARVNTGEVYDLVNEEEGWFQVKLGTGTLGWISSQYAKMQ